ncbi:isochorismatase family protein [Sinorhizobium fredii]|uniref:N-carbamoylsarcosine amidase n=1 Tax=Sinorhizobium fredii (strain HH103) TaxID=1117943 RepID=G9AJH6_SINF1|nr:isochorismatase family protein [Sinorhizobium fredii]CCF01208.1 N-carbamoylsarcosine amidase [Sinorhizobium fredii HH103]
MREGAKTESRGARAWDRFLTERDREVIGIAGYGARQGFGTRPALLVVDVNYAFCGDRREPVQESILRWRQSGGEEAWDALPIVSEFIDLSRSKGLPVIYTTGGEREDKWDRGSWLWKNSRCRERPKTAELDGNTIMPQVAPAPQDIVIHKQKPSAFHGTNLIDYLFLLKCDSLIVMGTATSGCVRATVVDAFSHNLRVAVVEDGCFERCQASHAMSLFDMNSKYADVLPSGEVRTFMEGLESGLFDLPAGSLGKA